MMTSLIPSSWWGGGDGCDSDSRPRREEECSRSSGVSAYFDVEEEDVDVEAMDNAGGTPVVHSDDGDFLGRDTDNTREEDGDDDHHDDQRDETSPSQKQREEEEEKHRNERRSKRCRSDGGRGGGGGDQQKQQQQQRDRRISQTRNSVAIMERLAGGRGMALKHRETYRRLLSKDGGGQPKQQGEGDGDDEEDELAVAEAAGRRASVGGSDGAMVVGHQSSESYSVEVEWMHTNKNAAPPPADACYGDVPVVDDSSSDKSSSVAPDPSSPSDLPPPPSLSPVIDRGMSKADQFPTTCNDETTIVNGGGDDTDHATTTTETPSSYSSSSSSLLANSRDGGGMKGQQGTTTSFSSFDDECVVPPSWKKQQRRYIPSHFDPREQAEHVRRYHGLRSCLKMGTTTTTITNATAAIQDDDGHRADGASSTAVAAVGETPGVGMDVHQEQARQRPPDTGTGAMNSSLTGVEEGRSSTTTTEGNTNDINSSIKSRNNIDRGGGEAAVRFGTVEIREYNVIPGDNPSCLAGPPLSIGWDYTLVIMVRQQEEQRPQQEQQQKQTRNSAFQEEAAVTTSTSAAPEKSDDNNGWSSDEKNNALANHGDGDGKKEDDAERRTTTDDGSSPSIEDTGDDGDDDTSRTCCDTHIPLIEYESNRPPYRQPNELFLPRTEREDRLRDAGYTRYEIGTCSRLAASERSQRRMTVNNLKYYRMHWMAECAGRKVGRALLLRTKGRDDSMLELWKKADSGRTRKKKK